MEDHHYVVPLDKHVIILMQRSNSGHDPKTSEYAYFRKLKKDASQIVCPLLKEDDQLKKFKPTECIRGRVEP